MISDRVPGLRDSRDKRWVVLSGFSRHEKRRPRLMLFQYL
jgi:hypothetical protein